MTDIAIIGAGPGGLMTALRLHQAGFSPKIYESVAELKPLGVGIDVKVYGTQEIDELGLLSEFEKISIQAEDSIFFNNFGQEIYAEKCGKYMGYPYDQRFVHRGIFQMMLLDAVIDRLGADSVITGARCVGYSQDAEQATVQLEHTDGTKSEVSADIVIAADGIKSAVRHQMHPESADPKYSGITMYRGTTLMKPYRNGRTIMHIGAPRIASLIVYPLMDNWEGTGLTLVNWVVEAIRDETVEDWNQLGGVDEILPLFDDTKIDFVDVQAMLRDNREVYLFPLIDHDPLDSWTDGRVTLLGDAAHAMYPRGGNGACQSFVDARVITEMLVKYDDPREALLAYEDDRREKVNKIVMANRGEGYEVIRRMVDDRTGGKRFDDIEAVLPLAEADSIFSKYHALVGMPRPGFEAGETTGYRTWEVNAD